MNVDKRFETEIVKKYRENIQKKKVSLFLKLFFDYFGNRYLDKTR